MNIYSFCKNLLSVLIIIAAVNECNGQSKHAFNIKGTIVDKDNKPYEYYLISLFSEVDSIKKKEVITDNNGSFEFTDVLIGNYFIKINTYGNEEIIESSIKLIERSIELGNIRFLPAIELTEIEIKSLKPTLKRSADHVALSVKDSYLSKSAYQVFEIMNLIPNLDASPEGIKIKNSAAILYLIDGKGNRNTNELNKQRILNMTNKDIDKIEVYTNPPARFDADGFAVLNVVTIKNFKISSFNSSAKIGLFQNYPNDNSFNYRNALNLNYKLGKLGIYMNADYIISQEVQSIEGVIEYKESNTRLKKNENKISPSNGPRVSAGLVYELNKNHEISFDYSFSKGFSTPSSKNSISIYTNEIMTAASKINLESKSDFEYDNINLGFWSKNNKTNYDIQIYYDGSQRYTQGISYIENEDDFLSNNKEKNYAIQINYQDSLFNRIKFAAGVKNSLTKSNETINNSINNGVFKYNENLQAAYTQFSGVLSSIEWNTGLRFENTFWQISNPSIRSNNFSNLFPSIYLTKNFKNLSINASYSRRIQRQNISELNPIININSNNILSVLKGDISLLKPQLFDSYELNLDLPFMTLSTYFYKTKNPRVYYPDSVDSLIINYLPQSAEYENTFGTNLKIPVSVGIFRLNFSASSNIVKSGLIDGTSNTGFSNSLTFNANIKLSENLTFSGSIRHKLSEKYGYYDSAPNTMVFFGLNYQKKESPFSFRINLADAFGYKYNNKFIYPLINENSTNISFQRAIQITFRYNFKLGKEFNTKNYEGNSR